MHIQQQRDPNRDGRRADQTDSSRQIRQVHITKSHKYEDEREQTATDRSGRCIAQNHINTEMNESRQQTDSRSRQHRRQQT
ncbi:hypothetical protein Tco_0252425 [Tanacetum coccineum]